MDARPTAPRPLATLPRLAKRLVDWPLPDGLDPTGLGLRRARLVIGFALLFIVVAIGYAIFSFEVDRPGITVFALLAGALMMAAPGLMKLTQSVSVGVNFIIFGGWLAVSGVAFITGGLEAPVIGWLTLVPTGATFLDGPRAGKIWFGVCLVSLVVFVVFDLNGTLLPEAPSDTLVVRRGVALVVLVALVALMMFLYDAAHTRLLNEVEAKNQALADAHAELAAAHVRLVADGVEQRRLELELRQSQKLQAVGRLAAGVAHELNTPLQFVSDSVAFVDDSVRDLIATLGRYREVLKDVVDSDKRDQLAAALDRLAQMDGELDLPFLIEQTPGAVGLSKEGLTRMGDIIRAMKEFAYADATDLVLMDVNQGLSNTLTISRAEYRAFADVVTHFGPLPTIHCRAGELSQVFLNLIVNAAHAIEDRMNETGERGVITITTGLVDGCIEVLVSDTGTGIPETIRDRIFDPFFTTKAVGRGSGQGLAISRSVIVDRHGGTLDFETELGRGTTFRVRLALDSVPMVRPS
jgi:signal transduction histidine kinase